MPNICRMIRPNKSDPTQMIQTEQTKIMPEQSTEIADLKLIWIENYPHWTKPNPSNFYWNYFSLQENLIGSKINRPEISLNWIWTDPKLSPNQIFLTQIWPDPKLIPFKPEPHDPFARPKDHIRVKVLCLCMYMFLHMYVQLEKTLEECKPTCN